ncbi:phosphoribosylamine--glycine ligase [Leifsonia shinshuensis]|uniref:Phosphoribosylamine--glycine ligase n=1 Tax=Leifsonia shinshuensis TaxID=150026 RepID=A0A853D2D4_9MICO|nr:phosphoribosylamine--glycine ligase [Leifsonia shinshuensis]NYJ24885.1 hypothetical protein [Leifsonia shinshuensis]
MSEIALLVSVFSLCVAALSLGWQIALWLLGGRRVSIQLRHGVLGDGGIAAGPVGNGKANDISSMRHQVFVGPEVVGVDVINVGRLPLTVSEYSLRVKGGQFSFVPHGEVIGRPLPFRLEPGESETWYVDAADARALARVHRDMGKRVAEVFMAVKLGTREEKRTKQTLALL